jgi:hypothetical protein
LNVTRELALVSSRGGADTADVASGSAAAIAAVVSAIAPAYPKWSSWTRSGRFARIAASCAFVYLSRDAPMRTTPVRGRYAPICVPSSSLT